PADPAALRAWLVRIARHDLDPSAGAAVIDMNVENELSDLLVDFPVPPRVRAAAFRALAGMPHVTSIGATHDELGRAGSGIEIRSPGVVAFVSAGSAVVGGKLNRLLIIDPSSSRVLADQIRVGRSSQPAVDALILDVGWTNAGPHTPALTADAPGGAASSA